MTSWIRVDGVYINYHKGIPVDKVGRVPARRLTHGQIQEEKIYRLRIIKRHFVPELSKIYLYMKSKIPDIYVPHEVFLRLGWFFSSTLHLIFPREAYRRKSTTIYWLNQHFDQIINYIHNHDFYISYKSLVIKLD